MPAKTNSKHPDHIQTESSKVAAEIEPILAELVYATSSYISGQPIAFNVKRKEALDALTTLFMRHKNDQAYTSYRLGFADAKAGKELTDREAYDQLPEGHGARG
jgi:hypothetical protein